MESTLFLLAFFLYAVSASLYLGYAITRRELLSRLGHGFIVGALVFHILSLIIRTVIARQIPQHEWYVPWSNWFESFSFFAAIIAVEFLVTLKRRSLPILGAFILPIVFGSLVMAVYSPFGSQIPTLAPALQSYWMAIHVPVMFIAYGAFANAFGVGLAYLIQERQLKSKRPSHLAFRLPSLEELDNLIYQIIIFALPILTLGVLLGARWAYDAWGRYWGWDAKETWAFISWFIYIIYVHMRLVVGWRGRKTVYLSMMGFLVVLFTYIGVNYISDLHGFLSNQGR